jgi:hypothetical protein
VAGADDANPPFRFPPAALGEWRELDEANRLLWLECARRRLFDGGCDVMRAPDRTIELDGTIVDGLVGFFCAIGEAVNGPGGYFGRSMQGFDDCLFSGFGLEYPYTIVWRHADASKRALGPDVLLAHLEELRAQTPLSEWEAEAQAWFHETHCAARRGARSMFEEIVETIESVTARGGQARLILA